MKRYRALICDECEAVVGHEHAERAREHGASVREVMVAEADSFVRADAIRGAVSEIDAAHKRLTREGVPTHDDHGKPLGLALRIGVALDPPGGR